MAQPVFLLCGVSGSGKTWVCKQLQDKFCYVPHDMFYEEAPKVIARVSESAQRPIITECPFGERLIKESMEKRGLKVIPFFVIEDPKTVRERYIAREKKELPKSAWTRATTIRDRAREWKAVSGTSEEILKFLKDLKI